ncbi:MAG TPA: hypothetical protein P5540_19990, partial [Candidatus Hydrogenedentes bacterium]|nr:hypothetical protein [Candidatus Hydrogenedentota bacterium]
GTWTATCRRIVSILGAPRIARLVPPEVEEEARQSWFARRNPEVAAEIDNAVSARDTLQSNFRGVKSAFEVLAGVEPAPQVVGKK